jgi:PEP-CTERM motif-containing protein
MSKKYFLAAGVGLLMSAAAAQATPITTPPSGLTAVGDVTAVYVFADAGDTSILNELTPVSINQIFCNHANGPCGAANNPGDVMDLGVQNGAMTFSLENFSKSDTFTSNAPDADGNYHVLVTTNYADFGLGALPGGADSVISGLLGGGQTITYVGWEDLTADQNSDFDYNDLIFAFANTRITTTVPEPLTVSLFGAGLVGAAWLRRRKSKRA